MPNHVHNKLTAPKEILDKIITPVENSTNPQVNFATITPEPEYAPENETHSTLPDWYQWRLKNWGTKWNAYNTNRLSDTEVSFDTAWASPDIFFQNLAQQHPEATITVEYADEDLGHNLGKYTLHNNTTTTPNTFPKEGTEEAVLWGATLRWGEEEAKKVLEEIKQWQDEE